VSPVRTVRPCTHHIPATFCTGLEGYRLRLLVAVVLGGALVLNRVLSPGEPVASQAFSEVLGATGSALLIWQVLAEEEAERERESVARRAAVVARLEELSEVSSDLAAVPAARGRWAASALLRLTPACAVLWAGGEDSVLLRYGRFDEPSLGEGRQPTALLRRLGSETAVAIDDVGDAVPELLPTASASVVLERCGSGLLAVVSERPGAFTSKHRTWIGWMARLLAED